VQGTFTKALDCAHALTARESSELGALFRSLRGREIGGFVLRRDGTRARRRCRREKQRRSGRTRQRRATARWIERPFERDVVIREQTPMLLQLQLERGPLRDVGTSQRLEFALQGTELLAEATVFSAEVCELFDAGQTM